MSDIETFRRFVDDHAPLTVLTGAGISTASGIPAYRDSDGNWNKANPVQYADFVGKPETRRRYWARSFAGWKNIDQAVPNDGHHALAKLQDSGHVSALITQNVDCLHDRAGSSDVIDLHGRLDKTICLSCGVQSERASWQRRLLDHNPDWQATVDYFQPDGDAELTNDVVARFQVPGCELCGGMIKPDVVFFGENVPKPRVAAAMQAVASSQALLVVGSSLMVFSGYRFARLAHQEKIPLAILNRGKTRADGLATAKFEADCGSSLALVAGL